MGVNLSNLAGNAASLTGPFPNVEFRQTNLTGVHLEGADFSTAAMDLTTILTQATYDQTTQWPPGVDPAARGAILHRSQSDSVITSSASVFVSENQLLSFEVNASDPDGNPLGFVIMGEVMNLNSKSIQAPVCFRSK